MAISASESIGTGYEVGVGRRLVDTVAGLAFVGASAVRGLMDRANSGSRAKEFEATYGTVTERKAAYQDLTAYLDGAFERAATDGRLVTSDTRLWSERLIGRKDDGSVTYVDKVGGNYHVNMYEPLADDYSRSGVRFVVGSEASDVIWSQRMQRKGDWLSEWLNEHPEGSLLRSCDNYTHHFEQDVPLGPTQVAGVVQQLNGVGF